MTSLISTESLACPQKNISSRIAQYFFGEDLEGALEVENFVTFQKELKKEVYSLEFDAYGYCIASQ